MLRKQIDFLAIGDMATDAFIRLKDPHIHCRLDHEEKELCLPFGAKVPFEYVKVVKAVGNAANAAVAASRLGLRSALVSDVGNDANGADCLKVLENDKVVTSFIRVHDNKSTNYHFVLWYGQDRTILVNHTDFDCKLPRAFKESSHGLPPRWLYLTSLAANTFEYHAALAAYLDLHPKVRFAFQPGTFQLGLGLDQMKSFYERADVLVMNLEEARSLLSIPSNHADIKSLLRSLAAHGPKIVLITDNTKGAYMFDGDHFYHMPIYPDPRPAFERTGCGDAFASTFVSALAMGRSTLEALIAAPVNPMSVAQFVGAQEGLLSLDQLEWWLERASVDYRPREL